VCTNAILLGFYHTFTAVAVERCRLQKTGVRMEKCYLSESYSVCPDPQGYPSGTPRGIGQPMITVGLHNILAELHMPVN